MPDNTTSLQPIEAEILRIIYGISIIGRPKAFHLPTAFDSLKARQAESDAPQSLNELYDSNPQRSTCELLGQTLADQYALRSHGMFVLEVVPRPLIEFELTDAMPMPSGKIPGPTTLPMMYAITAAAENRNAVIRGAFSGLAANEMLKKHDRPPLIPGGSYFRPDGKVVCMEATGGETWKLSLLCADGWRRSIDSDHIVLGDDPVGIELYDPFSYPAYTLTARGLQLAYKMDPNRKAEPAGKEPVGRSPDAGSANVEAGVFLLPDGSAVTIDGEAHNIEHVVQRDWVLAVTKEKGKWIHGYKICGKRSGIKNDASRTFNKDLSPPVKALFVSNHKRGYRSIRTITITE